MKKPLLSFIVLSSSLFTLSAQITITQADMPQPGDTIRLSTTTDTTGLPTAALTGAGITWDYSGLIAASQTIDTFLNVGSTPAVYQLIFNDATLYPAYKATVAQSAPNPASTFTFVTISNVINYYLDESGNYESVGYGATINSIPTPVKDDYIDIVYDFPMNYGNSDSCHSSSHLNIPSLGYYGTKQYRINYVDGWGTLITPYGTYSTLKVKTILYSSDSLYVDTFHIGFATPQTETIQYKWLAIGQPVPLLQINETVKGSVTTYNNTVYRDSIRHTTAGIAGINNSLDNASLYPNPANENTALSYSLTKTSSVNIAVYSVDGRCVSNLFSGERQAGNHNFNIDISQIPSGIYLLKMEAGGQETVKKLVVIR